MIYSLLDGSLGLLRQHRERGGIGNRQLGQHLAVDVDAGNLQAVDQLGIAQAVDAGGRVDAGDPQAAEVALFQLATDVGVAQRTALLNSMVPLPPLALNPSSSQLIETSPPDTSMISASIPS